MGWQILTENVEERGNQGRIGERTEALVFAGGAVLRTIHEHGSRCAIGLVFIPGAKLEQLTAAFRIEDEDETEKTKVAGKK